MRWPSDGRRGDAPDVERPAHVAVPDRGASITLEHSMGLAHKRARRPVVVVVHMVVHIFSYLLLALPPLLFSVRGLLERPRIFHGQKVFVDAVGGAPLEAPRGRAKLVDQVRGIAAATDGRALASVEAATILARRFFVTL